MAKHGRGIGFVSLFGLRFYVQVNIFFSYVGTFSWVEPVLSKELKFLAQ